MPGHRVQALKKETLKALPKKSGKSVTKLQNGVYIIKDNSVVNQAGVEFNDNFVKDILDDLGASSTLSDIGLSEDLVNELYTLSPFVRNRLTLMRLLKLTTI